jgi:hypothetical protein
VFVLRGPSCSAWGKWLQFNEDYLEALDCAIRIEVETTEEDLAETSLTEGEFNASLSAYGYNIADKDLDILKTAGIAPSEAWGPSEGRHRLRGELRERHRS